tara:strand:+ start:213 stop:482 length:270 start_codon:yes stop_codon:yes gene_type:complete
MSWEIWQDQASCYPESDDKHTTYRIGFFCNTTDVSFGPVMYFDVSMGFEDAQDEIYHKWSATDPRNGTMTDSDISDEIYRIMEKEPEDD